MIYLDLKNKLFEGGTPSRPHPSTFSNGALACPGGQLFLKSVHRLNRL